MITNILRIIHLRIRFIRFIEIYCGTSDKDRRILLKYKRLSILISKFENKKSIKIYTTSFDLDTVRSFVAFLESVKSEKTRKSYLRSSIIGFVDSLKSLLNIAKDKGYNVVLDGVREFRLRSENSTAIYLSMDEISKLNGLKLNRQRSQVRDLFIIGCFTALRLSDYSSLDESNFDLENNQIRILTKKTKEPVIIPMHPMIRKVIERNKGYSFLKYEKSDYSFNKALKQIAKYAGLTDEIYIERTRGGKIEREKRYKYELISSHTARRSGATNMYLSGIPVFRIMLVTGHNTESSFLKYIKIRKEENANFLLSHPFFKNNP